MQGLRKRRTAEEAAPDEPSSSAVVETLKALDVYPKTLDDFKERTGSGAAISLVSCTAIFLPSSASETWRQSPQSNLRCRRRGVVRWSGMSGRVTSTSTPACVKHRRAPRPVEARRLYSGRP